jgi:hypothetical protein
MHLVENFFLFLSLTCYKNIKVHKKDKVVCEFVWLWISFCCCKRGTKLENIREQDAK